MSGTLVRYLKLGTLATVLVGLPIIAEASDGIGVRHHRPHAVRPVPFDLRYRHPRAMRVRAPAPDFLIEGYLPRTTETPIYNEPPNRFPGR